MNRTPSCPSEINTVPNASLEGSGSRRHRNCFFRFWLDVLEYFRIVVLRPLPSILSGTKVKFSLYDFLDIIFAEVVPFRNHFLDLFLHALLVHLNIHISWEHFLHILNCRESLHTFLDLVSQEIARLREQTAVLNYHARLPSPTADCRGNLPPVFALVPLRDIFTPVIARIPEVLNVAVSWLMHPTLTVAHEAGFTNFFINWRSLGNQVFFILLECCAF